MDFFSRGYNALRGEKGQTQSVDTTIQRLSDCLETATLLEDRRAGVLSLKGLVKDWKREVGEMSLPALIKVLRTDYRDVDITKSLLETLIILCTPDEKDPDDAAVAFTDTFLEDPENVTILLDIVEEYDFYIRFSTIKFLAALITNRCKRIQECLLTSPMAITRLVDLLDDKREIIRNEGLLLLIDLTRSNAEVQKMVTFQETFEKLLALIEDQEGISGDIIVQDSLTLMQNLLRYNVSDQVYFRESSCIQQIPGLLGYVGDSDADHIPFSIEDWPEQKIANTVEVLVLIRILAEPDGANTTVNQQVMVQSGILPPMIQLALCSNAPPPVRTEALYALAYVMRDNEATQDQFTKAVVASPPSSLPHQENDELQGNGHPAGAANGPDHHAAGAPHDDMVSHLPPRPAMVSLIAITVNNDPSFTYSYTSRAAAAYAMFSCVDGNHDTQLVITSMMKSPPIDNVNSDYNDRPHSAGSLLLDAIENWELSIHDPYKVWFACAILSHLIKDNEQAKQVASGIVFGEQDHGEEPVPLLHHLVAQLLMSTKNSATNARIPIAYLCLLCVWLYDSPKCVSLFLSESTHVQFMIQEVQSSTNDPIVQGLAAFLLGITYQFNDDPNTPISRENLQAIYSSRVDILNSHMVRLRDSPVIKNALPYSEIVDDHDDGVSLDKSLPMLMLDMDFVEFFKDVHETMQRAIKRKPSSFKPAMPPPPAVDSEELASYKAQIQYLEQKVASLEVQVAKEQERSLALASQVQAMEKEQEDIMVIMGEQDLVSKKYRARLRQLGEQVTDSEEEDEDDSSLV
ncbi:p115 like vesicle tethering protein [Gongronella butleri]|nr:p115 like vesicle tethering protein [Gongronella butleri]